MSQPNQKGGVLLIILFLFALLFIFVSSLYLVGSKITRIKQPPNDILLRLQNEQPDFGKVPLSRNNTNQSPAVKIEINAIEQNCEVDDNCTLVKTRCNENGCGSPINKKHQFKYQELYKALCPESDDEIKIICETPFTKCINRQCALSPVAPDKDKIYQSHNPEQCARLFFDCPQGHKIFNDEIGCGCVVDSKDNQISNFDQCVAAGFPVMESYPRQCRDDDGNTFVEQIRE